MTAHKIRKISLDQLQPGMFVGNVFNDRGVLLYSANTLISDYAQIEALRRQGVDTVGINLQRGADCDAPADVQVKPQQHVVADSRPTPPSDVFEENRVVQAIKVREEAINTVHKMMTSARSGRLCSLNSISDCIESIIEEMLDEPDLLMNVCRMKSKSPETYEHSVNVAVLMIGFSSALRYSRDQIFNAGLGGILHDIGKVSLPDELLLKMGCRTRQENERFEQHPDLGLEIMEKAHRNVSPEVRNIIHQHHERLNGSGYPRGLRGDQIHEQAFICAISDVYDILTTQGFHSKKFIPQEALALIFQGAEDEYPRELVEYFTKLLGIYPVGSFVKLESGEMGIVVKNNRRKLLTPVVKVLFNESGSRLVTPYIRDLSANENGFDDADIRIINSLDPNLFNVATDAFFR